MKITTMPAKTALDGRSVGSGLRACGRESYFRVDNGFRRARLTPATSRPSTAWLYADHRPFQGRRKPAASGFRRSIWKPRVNIPVVAEATVIGVYHPKWDERPP
jgi:hypothetical protein